VPRVVLTDTRASDGAALRAVLRRVEHRRHQRLHNRAEHAHQPTRERERRMRRGTSPGHAQRFRAASGPSAGHRLARLYRLDAAALFGDDLAPTTATGDTATGAARDDRA